DAERQAVHEEEGDRELALRQRRDEERGQVPGPPDRAKDQRRRQGAPASEQARQGETAPPELLPQRPVGTNSCNYILPSHLTSWPRGSISRSESESAS